MSGWSNQAVSLIILTEQTSGFSGIFGYSPSVGAGNLVFSVSATAGVDPFGNSYPAGISTTAGNSTIQGDNYVINSSGAFFYNQNPSTSNSATFSSGSGNWTAPAGVTQVNAQCWGAGQGGSNGNPGGSHGGASGGGGEFAQEAALVVVAGNSYAYSVGGGGAGGAGSGSNSNPGSNGGTTTFAGASVTVTAHGGGTGGGNNGGSGSTNTTNFPGGNGATGATHNDGGAGAGSSAGTAAAGVNGNTANGDNGGAGGVAPSGGGNGGKGGNDAAQGSGGSGGPGVFPGGGGGGGGFHESDSFGEPGGAGANGKIKLSWTGSSSVALIASICGVAASDPITNVACPAGFATFTNAGVVLNSLASTPAAISGATIFFANSNGKAVMQYPAGTSMHVPGSQLALFPGNTVTQSVLTNLASATYPANDTETGSVYELEVWGNGTQGTSAQTLQFAVVFGGNTMANATLGSTVMQTSGDFRWNVKIRVICHTTGVSGTWTSLIEGTLSLHNVNLVIAGSNSNSATIAFVDCESTGTQTVDTTSSQTLSLQAAWGSTTGSPTLTSRVSQFRRVA